MAASVQFRPHNRDLGVVMREVDEEIAIFLGMKNGADPKSNGLGEEAFHSLAYDSLLNSETGKSDHDWLLSQQDAAANRANDSISEGISLNSEQLPISSTLDSSAAPNRRPLSSNGQKPSSRASTPSRRPSLPSKSKPRASTPTSRAPSRTAAKTTSKPMGSQVRSSTPTSRSTTPVTSTSKPVSRSSTPSARNTSSSSKSATSSASTNISASSGTSSGRRTNPVAIKSTSGDSQALKSRPSKPLQMLSVSQNAPQSAKTSVPKRPSSASRGRPNVLSKVKPRQKSCSPPKARAKNGSTVTALSRSRVSSHGGGDDDVNPVLMGTQMVERVVNMRKLAPPKQEERASFENPKKSSLENSGFGRSLSKKSLDMAMRHMDIRRSISGSLKPVATTVPSHFSNGNQSSSSQSSSFGVSESPITSSSDSSKSSNCVSSYFLDGRD